MDMIVTAPDAADLDWVVEVHRRHYEEREGFDSSFSPLVRSILQEFSARSDPRERGWIARRGADRLGCIFCSALDDTTAQVRLFYVDPAARGQGLGRRLLEGHMTWARTRGFLRIRLWTHESHRAACALYAASGFTCDSSEPVTSYGCNLVKQTWSRDL